MDYETIKYQSKNGELDMIISIENKIAYMTAQNIATLFGKEKSHILKIIRKILNKEDEILFVAKSSLFVANKAYSVAKFATEWKRKGQIIQRKTEHYNLNIIIEIGVQLISNEALFLKEYIDNYFKERSNFNDKNVNDIIIYNNGNISIDVRVSPKEDTIWLTQEQIAVLFDTTKQNISDHIQNIIHDNELENDSVVKESFTTQVIFEKNAYVETTSDIPVSNQFSSEANLPFLKVLPHVSSDGKTYDVIFYNLDMVLAVGYRVKSQKAIRFRRWATKVLKQYLLKGYSIDQKRTIVTDENFMNLTNEVLEIKEQVRQIKEQQKNLLIEDKIILDGEVFDAHIVITKIIETAHESILLIDPYVDATTLDKFKAKNKDISF